MQETNPHAIEKKSMKIIADKIGQLDCTPQEAKTIKRVIHATAEIEMGDLVRFSPDAVNIARKLIEDGADIITDVNMLKAGINERRLEKFGGQVKCFISDEEIRKEAEKTGLTRSIISMRKAVKLDNRKIFVIGNAPTALFELIRMIDEDDEEIDFIVGTPVGFVGAEESKDKLMETDIPYISLKGKRGGSSIAASIINSIIYMIGDNS